MNDTGLVAGNVQNQATDKTIRNSSKFDMSYNLFYTARFGELIPHFVMECVPKDRINLRSAHELRTYSMKAPLMQDIEIKKDYFAVPMEAILPLNWEKIYTNPVLGDDINAADYGCYFNDFYVYVNTLLNKIYTGILDTSLTNIQRVELIFRWFSIGSLFYSRGSLLHQLGFHKGLVFTNVNNVVSEFDKAFESALNIISLTGSDNFQFTPLGGSSVNVVSDSAYESLSGLTVGYMTLRMFLDYIMHNPDWHISGGSASKLTAIVGGVPNFLGSLNTSGAGVGPGVNYSRVMAYQIVCAHYYSNDAVDYVYSAELYRQYIFSLLSSFLRVVYTNQWYNNVRFTLNGIDHYPDYLSSRFLSLAFNIASRSSVVSTDYLSDNFIPFYQYLISMFGYNNSLRYLDYFTGSKTRPLAVGNVDVNTSGASVSVVDITRNIQIQRFLNSVNRSGRKFSSYIKGLFGDNIAPDYHNPFYIGHTSDKAVAVEVENSGPNQLTDANSVTAIAKSNASKYAFEFVADRPCILIGITYFDIARNYSDTFDRQLFHVDRYDMFNPYLQFVGDQAIKEEEYDPNDVGQVFGYQLRYSEYKQRINNLVGGFVDNLPGFAFDASQFAYFALSTSGSCNQNPDFIRSHPWELDKFYISLTGRTLSSYFHFIVKSYNSVEAVRPMAFAPSIL